jgi:hypothetical protein
MKLHPLNYQQARPALVMSTAVMSAPKRKGPALSQASRQSRLEQAHGRERREFETFQEHIRQLMQSRHRQEEASLHTSNDGRLAVLVRQQARERDELQTAQQRSLQLLKEKQAQEKAELLRG